MRQLSYHPSKFYASLSRLRWIKRWGLMRNAELRIPDQSCHLFQPNAATHSISKLPPIPVNAATH